MSRVYCIPGIAFLAIAFVLNFLVSISLPSLHALDIVRVKVTDNFSDFDFGELRVSFNYIYWTSRSSWRWLADSLAFGKSKTFMPKYIISHSTPGLPALTWEKSFKSAYQLVSYLLGTRKADPSNIF